MSQDFRLKLSRRDEGNFLTTIRNTKQENCLTYRIELEDHTLGDLLRIFLLKEDDISFAGYKVPHPLEDVLEIKVQTHS